MTPKITPLVRRLHALAKRHHMPFALGRALVMANRHYNDGWSVNRHVWGVRPTELDYMRRIRIETAKRWLLHWAQGGSLKSLRYSRVEMAAIRKQRDAEKRRLLREWRHGGERYVDAATQTGMYDHD